MAKPAKSSTTKVKDLGPKSGVAKDVKGGAVGPCNRSQK